MYSVYLSLLGLCAGMWALQVKKNNERQVWWSYFSGHFSRKCDESCDVVNTAQFLIFVRGITKKVWDYSRDHSCVLDERDYDEEWFVKWNQINLLLLH